MRLPCGIEIPSDRIKRTGKCLFGKPMILVRTNLMDMEGVEADGVFLPASFRLPDGAGQKVEVDA
jgi:hypothetical protein